MDANIKPEAGDEFYKEAWRASFEKFLETKENFGHALSRLQIRLPFGHYNKLAPILEDSGALFGSIDPEIFKKNYNLGTQVNYVTLTFRRVETSKGTTHKIFLEQQFPGKVSDTFLEKLSGFQYSWNSRKVTIKRFINTSNVDVVAEQIDILLNECTRFNLMYCET